MFEKQAFLLGKWGWAIIQSSFFWLVGNFIYVFLGLQLFLAETYNEVGTLILTGIILIPFVFSSGTTAAFYCLRSIFDEEKTGVWNQFKKAYKENYKLAFKQGIVYLTGLFILYTAFWYYGKYHIIGQIVPGLLAIFWTTLFLFVLSYLSKREESQWDYWKLGVLLLINHPIFTLFMSTGIFFILYFCHYVSLLLLLVAPGAILILINYFFDEIVKAETFKLKTR